MGARPVGQRGEVPVDGEAGHQLKFNTQNSTEGHHGYFSNGGKKRHLTCFTYYFHKVCQTTSQEVEENPHYSSHKSA